MCSMYTQILPRSHNFSSIPGLVMGGFVHHALIHKTHNRLLPRIFVLYRIDLHCHPPHPPTHTRSSLITGSSGYYPSPVETLIVTDQTTEIEVSVYNLSQGGSFFIYSVSLSLRLFLKPFAPAPLSASLFPCASLSYALLSSAPCTSTLLSSALLSSALLLLLSFLLFPFLLISFLLPLLFLLHFLLILFLLLSFLLISFLMFSFLLISFLMLSFLLLLFLLLHYFQLPFLRILFCSPFPSISSCLSSFFRLSLLFKYLPTLLCSIIPFLLCTL
jgi:hypothetical protein